MGGRVNGFDCGVEANEEEVRVGLRQSCDECCRYSLLVESFPFSLLLFPFLS